MSFKPGGAAENIAEHRRIAQIHPTELSTYRHIARLYLARPSPSKTDVDAAESVLRRAIDMNVGGDQHAALWLDLGLMYVKHRAAETAKGLSCLRRYVSMATDADHAAKVQRYIGQLEG